MQQAKGNQGILATYDNIYGGLQKKVLPVKHFAQLEQEREELSVREAASSPAVAVITGPRPYRSGITLVHMG